MGIYIEFLEPYFPQVIYDRTKIDGNSKSPKFKYDILSNFLTFLDASRLGHLTTI